MGQNFERCTIGHFQTLSTSITPGSLNFFECHRKECNQGFQETYTLYTFTRFCTSHRPPNAKKLQKVMFLHFLHLFGTIL